MSEIILFAGKWMELDIMLSEVSQVQKDKVCMFSLICGRQIQKINVHKNSNMTIYTYRENMFEIVDCLSGLGGGGRGKEKKRE
jgi:hypothetical protein